MGKEEKTTQYLSSLPPGHLTSREPFQINIFTIQEDNLWILLSISFLLLGQSLRNLLHFPPKRVSLQLGQSGHNRHRMISIGDNRLYNNNATQPWEAHTKQSPNDYIRAGHIPPLLNGPAPHIQQTSAPVKIAALLLLHSSPKTRPARDRIN